LLNVATPIPLLSKEGRRGSAGVVNKVAKLPLRCREASAFQFGALREYLRGGYASIQTTPSAARTPLLEKEGNFVQTNVEQQPLERRGVARTIRCVQRPMPVSYAADSSIFFDAASIVLIVNERNWPSR
jgi:hypothetical protein